MAKTDVPVSCKKFIVVGLSLGLLFLSLGLFLNQYFRGPGMVAPFKEVQELTRNISLLSTVDGSNVILTNLMQGKGYSAGCVYHYQYSQNSVDFYDSCPAIAVVPDSSRFYICQENTIAEYNSSGHSIRNFHIPEFDLNPYQYRRLEKAEASNEMLWLSVIRLQ